MMNSAEAREYVRLATTETKGRTKTACDLLIAESIKLEKIEQIIEDWDNQITDEEEDFDFLCNILNVITKE